MEKLRKAEEYLSMLESEDRSVATNDWLHRFHSVVASDTTTNNPKEKRNGDEEKEKEGTCHNNNTEDGPSEPQPQWDTHARTSLSIGTDNTTLSPAQFAIASTLYLLTKAEVCQQEILDFRLSHVLAPKIRLLGKPHLRTIFRKRFLSGWEEKAGDSTSSSSSTGDQTTSLLRTMLPNTTAWITETIEHSCIPRENLRNCEQKAAEAIMITGWIDGVIFRRRTQPQRHWYHSTIPSPRGITHRSRFRIPNSNRYVNIQ